MFCRDASPHSETNETPHWSANISKTCSFSLTAASAACESDFESNYDASISCNNEPKMNVAIQTRRKYRTSMEVSDSVGAKTSTVRTCKNNISIAGMINKGKKEPQKIRTDQEAKMNTR